jgi:hypothetical protein
MYTIFERSIDGSIVPIDACETEDQAIAICEYLDAQCPGDYDYTN